jgi:hypothetical protein
MLLQGRDHPIRDLDPPRVGHRRGGHEGWVQRFVQHRLDPLWSAEGLNGLGMPGGALLAEGPGFVFAVSGLQRGLLRQLQHLHPARRPAMELGEVGGELGAADVDDLSPG